MTQAPAIKPKSLGSMAPGLNNRLKPTELAVPLPGGGFNTYLYRAENVDIDSHGVATRRGGVTSAIAGNSHSLWGDDSGALAVIDGVLVALAPSGATVAATQVRTGMPAKPLSYSRGADGDAYWSNGIDLRRVTSAGADRPAVTAAPQLTPNVSIGSGGLVAGKYLVAVTIEDQDGESAASDVVQLDIPAGGSISLSSPEQLTVYMSGPDGDILQRQGQMNGGAITVSIFDESQRVCRTLNLQPMPAGQIVRHFNGSMLVAAGNVLHYSRPYLYGLHKALSDYIPFPAPITVIESTGSGVYVCSDQTYWIPDLTLQQPMTTPLPYGGILGSSGLYVKDSKAYWQSKRGLVITDDNGNAKAVQEEALAFGPALSGASLLREFDGRQHIVTTRFSAQQTSAVAKTWMTGEIIRKGTP